MTGITSSLKRCCLFFLLLETFAFYLHGATLVVPSPPASIQTVINTAVAGDVVQLSSGTYVEEIYINKNITLQGNGIGVSIIQCPTTPNPLTNSFVFTPTGATYHPFVMVENATNVVIQNLTVDGNSQSSNFLSYRFEGVGYHNAGGTVQNVRVTNVQDSSPGGATQHGFAIAGAVDNGTTYTINVLSNTVDNFQKAGIDMRGATLVANITNNIVTGETPPSTANANGIVVQFGAQVTIDSNTVNHLLSTVSGNDAVSILLNNAGANCSVTNNTTNNSDIGIYSNNLSANLVISGNTVSNNTDVGIYVQDTNGLTTLQDNIMTDNTNANMFLVNLVSNVAFQLGNNQFNGGIAGLVVQGSGLTGPIVTMNADSFIGSQTYYIQEISAPNDIWPSTSNVSFDGLVSGSITFAQYTAIRTKILDQRSPVADPSLGLVLDFIISPPASFEGHTKRIGCCCNLWATWEPSPAPNVRYYRIYNGTELIKSVPAWAPRVFLRICTDSDTLCQYSITAVDAAQVESAHTPITITSDPGDNCGCTPQ